MTQTIQLSNLRMTASYQLAKKEHLGNSMWKLFFDYKHKNIHDVFKTR